jgi:TRAP-type mannitol/chloroaromatic compound transport system permease small subunit
VVGIHSQIYSRTGGCQGVSFAIPTDLAVRIKDQIVATGSVRHARLGMVVQEVNQALADAFGLQGPEGAPISRVEPSGPAGKAGLKAGDVVQSVDGRRVVASAGLPGPAGRAAGAARGHAALHSRAGGLTRPLPAARRRGAAAGRARRASTRRMRADEGSRVRWRPYERVPVESPSWMPRSGRWAEHRAMHRLAFVCAAIDRLNRWIGRATAWLILASVLLSAGNAVVRKVVGISSNAWLEAQWYLYAAAFLLAAGYVLLVDEHVRIDAVAQRFAPRVRAAVDIVALLLFVLPLCALMLDLGWAFFLHAWHSGERSYNAGGLLRWPVLLAIPAGFALLALQAVSELLKRIAFLAGRRAAPNDTEADLPPFLGAAPGQERRR